LNNKTQPAEILDTIGVLHLKMEHLQDAQSYLEEAVSRKPHSAEAQMHLGDVYKKQDRPDLAQKCYQRAERFDARGDFKAELKKRKTGG
jgi:uncharacterized protein HemY